MRELRDRRPEDARERRERERQEYHRDVVHAVWQAGKNPDRADYDRINDGFFGGVDAASVANREIQRQTPRPAQEPEREEEPEDEDSED